MLELSAQTDPELMARVAGGDELALGAIYDRHASIVYGAVLRFLRDSQATEEIVQDTFLTAWRRSDSYLPEAGSLVGWLLRIARNRAIDRMRSRARRPSLIDLSALADDRGGDVLERIGGELVDGPSVDTEPGTVVARQWASSVVRTALSAMPDHERRTLELAYDEGLTQTEIAARLGWPLGTVKSRTRRGLAALRTALEGVPGLLDGVALAGSAGSGSARARGDAGAPRRPGERSGAGDGAP
jgi:RNA polymerase sigma-70 factor (ECF subfamily)